MINFGERLERLVARFVIQAIDRGDYDLDAYLSFLEKGE